MIARVMLPTTVRSLMMRPRMMIPQMNRMRLSMMYAIARVTTAAGASAEVVAWTVTKRLPSSAALPPGTCSARSISGRVLASAFQFAPRDVGRLFGAEKRLECLHICADAVRDPFEEDPVERHERDRLPHSCPTFVPRFDPHVRTEGPTDGALARA